uniref:Uncharacterized protein n=1 Tax=Catharus ustulatus TaxID=91951 RepID=A0A8C3TQK5_CATUS
LEGRTERTGSCHRPSTAKGEGKNEHEASAELKQAARYLGRKQPKEPQELKPRVTNSSYHLPLSAITAAHGFRSQAERKVFHGAETTLGCQGDAAKTMQTPTCWAARTGLHPLQLGVGQR